MNHSQRIKDTVLQAYEQFREPLFRFLTRLGLPSMQAQEITQECFLRMQSQLLAGGDITAPRAWLFQVAHNIGVREAERSAREEALTAAQELQSDHPFAALESADRTRRLHFAIDQLSVQQRRCLLLRAEGLRYREIGEVLGIETSTAAEFVRRAVAQLRKVLYEG